MFTTALAAQEYVFAGKATFTLKSLKTGNHFTYRVTATDSGDSYFVSALTGPEDYQYLGFIDQRGFRLTRASVHSLDAPVVKAFRFFLNGLGLNLIPRDLEVRHEGVCGRCGRPLTRPDSIDRGLGPECAEVVGR